MELPDLINKILRTQESAKLRDELFVELVDKLYHYDKLNKDDVEHIQKRVNRLINNYIQTRD